MKKKKAFTSIISSKQVDRECFQASLTCEDLHTRKKGGAAGEKERQARGCDDGARKPAVIN
jgi:hypothetical protein